MGEENCKFVHEMMNSASNFQQQMELKFETRLVCAEVHVEVHVERVFGGGGGLPPRTVTYKDKRLPTTVLLLHLVRLMHQ